VSLRNLAYFYVNNYNRFTNPKIFRSYIVHEYKAIKLKREKLKLGAIVFSLCEFRYRGILVYHWFEVLYTNQSNSQYISSHVRFKNAINFIKWSWDFNNIFALSFLSSIFYDICSSNWELFVATAYKPTPEDVEFNKAVHKNLYSSLDFKSYTRYTDFFEYSVPVSDMILKALESSDFLNIII